jgi:lipid II:glycine glycyltransferase (peptidoglycan interpeptide bridge formation enzyme)
MVIWEKYPQGSARLWDDSLLAAQDYTVFQSFGWGEYKRRSNWRPVRYWLRDAQGKVLGMAQFLLKSLPLGVSMLWAAGGPVLAFQKNGLDQVSERLEGLVAAVRADHPRALVRFDSHLRHDPLLSYNTGKVCRRPFVKLNSGFSIQFDTTVAPELTRQQMASKHRYYAKKAGEAHLAWCAGNDDGRLRELTEVHREMVNAKKLGTLGTSYQEVEAMREALGGSLLVLTGSLDGIPVTSCLVLLFGCKAFYLMASTGKRGREVSAAYAMFERLMQELRERGITRFDFGGIDPVNPAAQGVNHYKRGFGGELVEYLGEWECASSTLLRLGVNTALRLRGGRA